MKNAIGWIFAGLGLCALVLSGLWLSQPEEAADDAAPGRAFVVPVTLTTLERADLEPTTNLSGSVRAARRASLGFDTGGIIGELAVEEADDVAGGRLLARLEGGDEEHELISARASLTFAQRQRDLLLAGEREEEKKRLFAVLEATEAETELARVEVDRGEKLLADRIISQSEQDSRVAAHTAAEKRRAAAEQEHRQALAGSRPEDIAIAEARVAEEEARVAAAEHALTKTELVAPWAGSVVRRYVSAGDYVSSGDPVFELVDLEHLEVHVEIPGRFAPRVGPESRVRITLRGEGTLVIERPLDATIAAADEAARSFRGIVRLTGGDDPARFLKPGMFANVELFLRRVEDELVVDTDAVLANDDGNFVVRAVGTEEDGLVAEIVPVRVLAQADGTSAVESLGLEPVALAPGDRIVLVGGDNAFPGAALLPRGETAPAQGERAGSGEPGAGGELGETGVAH